MSVEAKGLSFGYPGRQVLRNIGFRIEAGDFIGITGSTGSGKTTLAYCLNGLIPHSIRGDFSGDVKVMGMSTKDKPVSEIAKKVGFVFQDPDWQLFSLSVRDEVEFGLKNLGFDRVRERAEEALKAVGLDGRADLPPHDLSHGQKQKLSIASVLAMEPDVIILDEPTSQLDHRSTVNIYWLLKELNSQGKTVIVVEHDTDLILEYADKVMILDEGKVAAFGGAREVLRKKSLLKKLGVKSPGAISCKPC